MAATFPRSIAPREAPQAKPAQRNATLFEHEPAVEHSDAGDMDPEDDSSIGVMDRVRQLLCGLHGHETLLQFEHDRMFLKCVSCGHQSPGWDLTEAPPRL